jgi:hypothetical protein
LTQVNVSDYTCKAGCESSSLPYRAEKLRGLYRPQHRLIFLDRNTCSLLETVWAHTEDFRQFGVPALRASAFCYLVSCILKSYKLILNTSRDLDICSLQTLTVSSPALIRTHQLVGKVVERVGVPSISSIDASILCITSWHSQMYPSDKRIMRQCATYH